MGLMTVPKFHELSGLSRRYWETALQFVGFDPTDVCEFTYWGPFVGRVRYYLQDQDGRPYVDESTGNVASRWTR